MTKPTNQTLALEPVNETETSLMRQPPSPAEMMQAMIEKGITHENVAAFKELVVLSEHMEDRKSARDFATDFAALMADMKKVQATKIIPDRNGNMRSSFAPFEEIDAQARPLCLQHGFSYWFSEGEFKEGRITKIFNLQHSSGHLRSNPYTVRIGGGPPGCTESQADGSAHSYAKRGAMCDGLTIVVHGIDNDARNDGAPITLQQAVELQRRVKLLNGDEMRFLALAGVKSISGAATLEHYKAIMSDKYPMLDDQLKKKEGAGR